MMYIQVKFGGQIAASIRKKRKSTLNKVNNLVTIVKQRKNVLMGSTEFVQDFEVIRLIS